MYPQCVVLHHTAKPQSPGDCYLVVYHISELEIMQQELCSGLWDRVLKAEALSEERRYVWFFGDY